MKQKCISTFLRQQTWHLDNSKYLLTNVLCSHVLFAIKNAWKQFEGRLTIDYNEQSNISLKIVLTYPEVDFFLIVLWLKFVYIFINTNLKNQILQDIV